MNPEAPPIHQTTQPAIHPVILCGGSGTRLWPLSRQQFPKQFVPLIDGKSLLTITAERLKPLFGRSADGSADETESAKTASISLVTAHEHRFLAREAVSQAGLDCRLLLEPCARNTAPAIVAAALDIARRESADALILVVPADNFIPDCEAFARAVRAGIKQAQQGSWVISGVLPSFPATGYGYIALNQTDANSAIHAGLYPDRAFPVQGFIEKPNLETAQKMLLQGGFFWNAGIFLVKASVAIQTAQQYCPGMVESIESAIDESNEGNDVQLGASFAKAQNISIDYAILEKHDDVAMVPFAGVWSDVGSWKSVAEITSEADPQGNRHQGAAHTLCDSRNNFIYAGERPIVAVGVEDLLIIDTPDAVLVAHQSAVERVKEAVAELDRRGVSQARFHRRVARPWGTYDSIDAGERFLVKRITVNPGSSLSLQLHHHRAEHWIVVKGTAKVTKGEEVFLLGENQSTFIPLGVQHRLENPGKMLLEMIEVQSGSYLDEDDIVRFSDQYGRL